MAVHGLNLSGIARELDVALMSASPIDELQHLSDTLRLREVPEVWKLVGFGGPGQGHKDLWDHTKRVVSQVGRRPDLRWAALFHDVGKPGSIRRIDGKVSFHQHEAASARLFYAASWRLNLGRAFTDYVGDLIKGLGHVESYSPEWNDSAVRRVCKELGAAFDDVVLLSRADITTRHDHKRRAHHAKMSELKQRADDIRAADLVPAELPTGLGTAVSERLGVPPGPQLGRLMAILKARVKDGTLPRQGPIEEYVEFITKEENRG